MKLIVILMLLLLAAITQLQGCGFQLRGAAAIPIQADSIYLNTRGARDVGLEVEQQLKMMDIALTSKADEAEYVLNISRERMERRVVSVSPRTGKAQEYELTLSADISIRSGTGRRLVSSETVSAERDYLFDETAIVSDFEDQRLIREELARQVAYQILLRLQAVTHQDPDAATAAAD